jgi:hypothetical protein
MQTLTDADLAGLRPGDVELIAALVTCRTQRQAAHRAGISEATLYRRAKSPAFQHALREARRQYLRQTIDALAGRPWDRHPLPTRPENGAGPGTAPSLGTHGRA